MKIKTLILTTILTAVSIASFSQGNFVITNDTTGDVFITYDQQSFISVLDQQVTIGYLAPSGTYNFNDYSGVFGQTNTYLTITQVADEDSTTGTSYTIQESQYASIGSELDLSTIVPAPEPSTTQFFFLLTIPLTLLLCRRNTSRSRLRGSLAPSRSSVS